MGKLGLTDRLLNNYLRVLWFIQCSFGRHTKFTIVRSQTDHTPIHEWCYKCSREWPI
jgi:hypothetical protein